MARKRFLVVNIGCIECGVPSGIVGRFASKEQAERVAAACAERLSWRHGGQNAFKVFDLEAPQAAEYAAAIRAMERDATSPGHPATSPPVAQVGEPAGGPQTPAGTYSTDRSA